MLVFYLSFIDDPKYISKFESLYHQYEQTVVNWANYYTGDHYAAEDVAQTVWIGIAKNIAYIQIDNEAMLLSYLHKSVKNASLNYFRDQEKSRQVVSFEEVEECVAEDFTDPIEQEEKYRDILRRIKEMPELYRDVLILYFVHGFPTAQIAVALQRSTNTVKSQLTRGRKMLQKILKGEEADDETRTASGKKKHFRALIGKKLPTCSGFPCALGSSHGNMLKRCKS